MTGLESAARIADVRAVPVRVPITRAGTMSGAKRTHAARTIVEVVADDGTVGLGETRTEEAAAIVNGRFAPSLVGADAFDRRGARARCLRAHPDYGFPEQRLDAIAFSAVEIAQWDLLGKRARLPLYSLLGGAVRDAAPFVAYAYAVDPDEVPEPANVPGAMAAVATDAVARTGATLFEFKVGVHPLDVEIAVVHAVREALGSGVALAVDANMGFTPVEAARFLAAVAPCRLANVEEPVAGLAALAALRRADPTPVSTHCVDLDALAAYPEIDAVVPEAHGMGGIGPTLELIAALAASGRQVWLRSMWELGVSWAVMCHLGVALPALARPAQCLIDLVCDDLVLGETWLVRDGGVRPPDRPGLGVELDREALDRYRTDGAESRRNGSQS